MKPEVLRQAIDEKPDLNGQGPRDSLVKPSHFAPLKSLGVVVITEAPVSGRTNLIDTKKFIEGGSDDYPVLSPGEERELAIRANKGDKSARQSLILHNQRLAIAFAKKYLNRGLPEADLYQEGLLGIIEAVDRFEVERRLKFSTYAIWRIRQRVGRAINEQARVVPAPVYVDDLVRRRRIAVDDLTLVYKRKPARAEIQEYLEITSEQMDYTEKALWMRSLASLEKPLSDDGDESLGDITPCDDEDVFSQAIRGVRKSVVIEMLNQLNDQDRTFLRLRYGLDGGSPLTFKEAGEHFGVSRESARAMEARIIDKILSLDGALRLEPLD